MGFCKNAVVVENGLNIGCEKVSELVCLYSSFVGDIDDNFEGEKTVY